MATLTTAEQIIEQYIATFGRAPDKAGLDYWVNQVSTHALTIDQVAQSFFDQPETQAKYPSGTTSISFITAVYNNAFGRLPDTAGLAYWANQLDSGAIDRSVFIQAIINGAHDDPAAIPPTFDRSLLTNQMIAAEYYVNSVAADSTHFNLTDAAAILAPVTYISSTIALSETLTDQLSAGTVPGQAFTLTTGLDSINVTAPNTNDTVNGVVNQSATLGDNSTYSTGDVIKGNGHTDVSVIMQAVTSSSAALVTMSDIASINFTNGVKGVGAYNVDGSAWTDVYGISVSGKDGLDLKVDGLVNANGGLDVNIAGASNSSITVTNASVEGMNAYLFVQNNIHNATGASVSVGTAGIDVNLGKQAYETLILSHTATGSKADASVGDIAIGHINVNIGASATADYVELINSATATGHNATAGNITVGDVNYDSAKNALGYLTITNHAEVNSGKGNAAVGDITLGNFSVVQTGTGAEFYGDITNSATARTGNATAGNIKIGDIKLDGAYSISLSVSNSAHVYVSGNATVGDITVGNVSMVGASTEYHEVTLQNSAYAAKGDATVGNINLGDVNMTVNATSKMDAYENYLYASNSASAHTGNAKVGNISVGNIVMNASGTGTNEVSLTLNAYAGKTGHKGGSATVGDINIGNVTMNVASSSNYLSISQSAETFGSKAADATVGNLTIGSINMTDTPSSAPGYNDVDIWRYAYAAKGNASVGNVNIGDITLNGTGITQAKASNQVSITNSASAANGAATVGTITLGNVSMQTGLSGNAKLYIDNYANGATGGDTAGKVTIGNIDMQGSKGADLQVTVYNEAQSGAADGVTIGNVSLAGNRTSGSEYLYVYESGLSVGNVKVGNVSITGASAGLWITNSASAGNAGTITVGNIAIKGDSGGTNDVYQYAAGNAGAITLGKVTLTAGMGEINKLHVTNSATGTVGTVKVGDISLDLSNKNAGTASAQSYFDVYTDGGKATGGDIVAGNIKISSSGVTTKATHTAALVGMTGTVSLDSNDGNVTVGNITVTGGVKEAVGAGIVVDNFATLSNWLHLSAKGDITVGNIDYSAYAAAATIDVSGYVGAGVIKGATAGSDITDNTGTNSIILGDTTKTDTIVLQDSQTAVVDTAGVLTATQSLVDSIAGFATGDTINVIDSGLITGIGGNGTVLQNTTATTWSDFLTKAAHQIDNLSMSAYTAIVDGNTYVALANVGDTGVGEIVEVVGVHTFGGTLTGGAVTFLS